MGIVVLITLGDNLTGIGPNLANNCTKCVTANASQLATRTVNRCDNGYYLNTNTRTTTQLTKESDAPESNNALIIFPPPTLGKYNNGWGGGGSITGSANPPPSVQTVPSSLH